MVAGSLGRDARQKIIVERSCGKHCAELTVQAANERESWEHCIYCAAEGSLPKNIKPASALAKAADQLLQAHPAVERIITEAKVLNGKFGGFDFSVVLRCPTDVEGSSQQRRLEVEVDGVQHFRRCMHGTTAQRQKGVDRRKDKAAWEAGRCLVRLHHLDLRVWDRKIAQALHRATKPCRKRFVLYTSTYNKPESYGPPMVSRAGLCSGTHMEHWVIGVVVVGGEGKDVALDQAYCPAGSQQVVNPTGLTFVPLLARVNYQQLLALPANGQRALRVNWHAGYVNPYNAVQKVCACCQHVQGECEALVLFLLRVCWLDGDAFKRQLWVPLLGLPPQVIWCDLCAVDDVLQLGIPLTCLHAGWGQAGSDGQGSRGGVPGQGWWVGGYGQPPAKCRPTSSTEL